MKKVFILIFILFPGFTLATSTSGTTMRGLIIDGFVANGAVPGNNNTFWETNEVFQGFNSIVDWYLTWDDTNLYLGRIGGDNLDGSVLYIRAEYPGATFNNRAFDFDGLKPDVTLMGGINFAAFLNDTPNDRFHTWNSGLWSAANNSLIPFFSVQMGLAHMEVIIPWNAITAGNGKPDNFRASLYQVKAASASTCSPMAEFVYAESPWGTGLVGDGPNVAVNDGVPTSLQQLAGCGAGDTTAHRWWGCYPVLGGVSSNGWQVLPADAGRDSVICETANTYLLRGNMPAAMGAGTWSLLSAPPGAGPVSIPLPNDPVTLAQNLDTIGVYTFIWTFTYSGCPSSADTVSIIRYASPPPVVVSPDQNLPCTVDSALIFGNAPGPQISGQGGTGQWILISGQGSISSPNDSMTWVTSLGPGANIFAWQITNGPCQMTSAQVTIHRFFPIYANAGTDQDLCAITIASLSANDPNMIQPSASGLWTQLSGPTTAMFTNPGFYNTNLSNLSIGTYQFIWTVSNGPCPSATDTVTLRIYDRPISNAGGDQFFCAEDLSGLEGNNPLAIAPTATGVWRQLSGPSPVIFTDSTQYNSLLSGLEHGTYKFAWIVRNGPCQEEADVVSVYVTALQDDGLDNSTQTDPGQATGTATLNPAQNGTPPYLYSLNGNSWQSNPTFSGLMAGNYIGYLMDDFGCLDTLAFEIEEKIPPPTPKDTLLITTGFSPNGDGTNDTWKIPGLDNYPLAVVEIFNVWGNLVYRTEGNYTPWNGMRNGKNLPPATYYFIIDLKTKDNSIHKGSLSLFR